MTRRRTATTIRAMIGCPQCGAEVSVSEQELYPTCAFCGTAFLLDGSGLARHLLVPLGCSTRLLRQAVRDHLSRSGVGPASPPLEEPDLGTFYFPFRMRPDGSTAPAFQSHVPELMDFRVPGSDWKVFQSSLVADRAVVLDPDPTEAGEGDAILHYPIVRATVRAGEEEIVLWLDASRGRVVAGDVSSFHPAPRRLPPQVLAGAGAVYFGLMLLLPLPWSVGAALVATPFLHRWGMRALRGPG